MEPLVTCDIVVNVQGCELQFDDQCLWKGRRVGESSDFLPVRLDRDAVSNLSDVQRHHQRARKMWLVGAFNEGGIYPEKEGCDSMNIYIYIIIYIFVDPKKGMIPLDFAIILLDWQKSTTQVAFGRVHYLY